MSSLETTVNFCQNLWAQYSRVKSIQERCYNQFRTIMTSGVDSGHEEIEQSVSEFEIELLEMSREWDKSFINMLGVGSVFGPEYETLEDLGNSTGQGIEFFQFHQRAKISKSGRLESLVLAEAPSAELAFLQRLPHLITLDLRYSKSTDFGPLSKLEKLQELLLQYTGITDADLPVLTDLNNLKSLRLYSTSVRDISPLQKLVNLEDLVLGKTQIDDDALSVVAGLPKLKHLDVSECTITDISPLANLPNLEELDISNTNVTDLLPLASLPRLKLVIIRDTPAAQQADENSVVTELKNKGVMFLTK